jgi:hypothetical protein
MSDVWDWSNGRTIRLLGLFGGGGSCHTASGLLSGFHKFSVFSRDLHKPIVVALSDNSTSLENYDLVGILDRVQAVGNDNDRAVLCQSVDPS